MPDTDDFLNEQQEKQEASTEQAKPQGELKKSAGIGTIVALTITAMIGSGLFFGVGIAASYAGPASLIAWALLGIITIYVGMCFGELVSMFPNAGGVYEFTKRTYGTFPSFLIGWITWLVGNMGGAVMLIGAMDYLFVVFPDVLPTAYAGMIKLGLSILIVVVLNVVTIYGIEASGILLGIFSALAIMIVLAIISVGMFHIDFANYTPFMPFSPIFIFVAIFFIVETFFGWESATFLAEETENAETVIPKALVWTSVAVSAIGFFMAFVILGTTNWEQLILSATPLSDVAVSLFGSFGASIVGIGIFLTLAGATAGGVVALPRLLLALARDKLFIDSLADIHPQYGTPHKAIIFQMAASIVMLFIGYGQYTVMLSLLVPMALLMYVAVLLCVVILRRRMPDHPRLYKAPLGGVGPILVSLVYFGVIGIWLFTETGAWQIFLIALSIIALGFPIYLLLTFYYNPDAIIPAVNKISTLTYWLEDFLLPKKVRKDVLALFQDYEGKSILEFGSGVGTMTMHLAELVSPDGHIYAVDLSKANLEIVEKRCKKHGHNHVYLIHDEHGINRVHPHVPNIDMVFSFGMLSYIQDLKKVLRELHIRLPENGHVCFIEYANLYKVLPNVGWISSPEKVKVVFKENGFSVQVQVYKGLLWDYMVVYGIKSSEGIPYV
jgi:basic amino acid/polyamine antiporter, APA family